MLHYNPRHVSSINMPTFRRINCIITASGIVTLCQWLYSMPDESRLKNNLLSSGILHQFWESRNDGEYFKLCKILREFPDNFREYYRMNLSDFDYILDNVKYDLQGYCNFRKFIESEEKLTITLRYVLVIVVRIKVYYICKMLHAIIV